MSRYYKENFNLNFYLHLYYSSQNHFSSFILLILLSLKGRYTLLFIRTNENHKIVSFHPILGLKS
jgi:hypothetical protein